MKLPGYNDDDDAYLAAIIKYGAHHGIVRGELDDDHGYCIRVRCHAAGILVEGPRYVCRLRNRGEMGANLVIVDTEATDSHMDGYTGEVCVVRESKALLVLAALNGAS